MEVIHTSSQTAPIEPGANLNLTGVTAENLRKIADDMDKRAPGSGAAFRPAAPAVAPIAPVAGGGVKTGLTTGEVERQKLAAGEVADMTTKSGSAAQMKELITDLRNQEAEGMYSGGIKGTEYFKRFANTLQAAGILPPEAAAKLANTQAWDATSRNLVAQAVSQFAGARIAARELQFFQTAKPDQMQTPEGREKIYRELYNSATRVQEQAKQAGEHLKSNLDLSNFQPKFADITLPAVKISNLPMTAPDGMTVKGDNGRTLRFNAAARKWDDVREPSLADRVPQ